MPRPCLCALVVYSVASPFAHAAPEPTVNDKTVADWVKDLQSDKGKQRLVAATALGRFGAAGKAAIEPLVTVAKPQEPLAQVRVAAFRSLGKIDAGSDRVAQAFLAALTDKDADVREVATQFYLKCRNPDQLTAVALAKAVHVEIRDAAVKSLAALPPNGDQPVKALGKVVENPDALAGVRISAAAALGRVKANARAATPALVAGVNVRQPDAVVVACLDALAVVAPTSEDGIKAAARLLGDKKGSDAARTAAAEHLGRLGKDAAAGVATLFAVGNDEGPVSKVHMAALRALARVDPTSERLKLRLKAVLATAPEFRADVVGIQLDMGLGFRPKSDLDYASSTATFAIGLRLKPLLGHAAVKGLLLDHVRPGVPGAFLLEKWAIDPAADLDSVAVFVNEEWDKSTVVLRGRFPKVRRNEVLQTGFPHLDEAFCLDGKVLILTTKSKMSRVLDLLAGDEVFGPFQALVNAMKQVDDKAAIWVAGVASGIGMGHIQVTIRGLDVVLEGRIAANDPEQTIKTLELARTYLIYKIEEKDALGKAAEDLVSLIKGIRFEVKENEVLLKSEATGKVLDRLLGKLKK